jgi:spore maturation protein CgeB
MMFAACERASMPLHVFDRNSNRLSRFLEFRFPRQSALRLHCKIPYTETAEVYKRYAVSLNVNSVTTSETMCSRRLLEILACGGICVTNPGPVVEKLFHEYCHVVHNAEEAYELPARLKFGPSAEDKARAAAGAAYVREHHTWRHRLQQLADTVGL